jgi:seryl-tRNA synthetase
MSELQHVVAAVTDAQRKIKEQIMRIHSFQAANEEAMQKIGEALHGSSKNYDTRLLAQLEKTNAEFNKTVATLQQADLALLRVSQI